VKRRARVIEARPVEPYPAFGHQAPASLDVAAAPMRTSAAATVSRGTSRCTGIASGTSPG